MAKKITEEEIYEMNRLYRELGSYSAVAREVGRAATTVKKYIDSEWVPTEEEPEYTYSDAIFKTKNVVIDWSNPKPNKYVSYLDDNERKLVDAIRGEIKD